MTDLKNLPADSEAFEVLNKMFSTENSKRIYYLDDGDPDPTVKGLRYWDDRLLTYRKRLEETKDEYKTKLNEQRNFWNYALTIFSMMTFPLLFTCSYWGMNFGNMHELDPNYWPVFPFTGVQLMWTSNIAIYLILFFICIKYGIIESAL